MSGGYVGKDQMTIPVLVFLIADLNSVEDVGKLFGIQL